MGEACGGFNGMSDAKTPPMENEVSRRVREAAARALAEAEARRRASAAGAEPPREIGGRGGPDPVRYGNWEVKGIASDF
jgi:hypothetical protein